MSLPTLSAERSAELAPDAPPTLSPEEAEMRTALEALEALERARHQGPEAVLALAQTLRGAALDAAMPEILTAHRQMVMAAPPPPATAPMSLAEEAAILQAQAELDAASRARALAFRDDPAENNAPDSPAPPQPAPSSALAADRTVGAGCTYATIGAAVAASDPGDRLLIEGGVTFDENLSIPITLTLQGGYGGCASGSTARTTIDGNASNPVIIVGRAIPVSLLNLNLTNGSTGLEGGGIRFARGAGTGTLNLTNVHIYGNIAQWGGGLWTGPDAEVTGENVHIYDNTATAFGGGVRLFGARATFENSYIHNNVAPRGGGVHGTREDGFMPRLNLPASTDIYDNEALTEDGFGGGVYLREGTVSLAEGSDIHSNNAIVGGGAYLITSTLTIAGDASAIMLNTATGNGGGVYALGSTVNVRDSAQLYNNSAQTGGGAYLDNSSLNGDKALIHHNTADWRGGGIYATNGSTLDMDLGLYPCIGPRCSQLSHNTAEFYYGGGVYVGNNSIADLRNTFVENNTATFGGGVFAYDNSTVYAYNNLFAGNNATSGTGDAIRLNLNVTMVGAGNTLAYNDAAGATTGQALGMTGGSSLSLHCSVIWGHANSINEAGHNVTYSNIQGGYAGTGNLNVDPLFVAPGSLDFHLQADSPVIDRCTYFSGMDTDFDNEPRPTVVVRPATPYDMGADEFSTPRVGINGDGCAYGTLTQAIAAAQDGDTLQVAAGQYFEAVDIIDKDLTIVGSYESDCITSGPGTTILDASYNSGSAVNIRNNAVTLRNLRITGGNAIGGGVDVDASLDSYSQATLDNVHVTGNTGTYGAGLYVGSRSVVALTNGTRIENNTATIHGGGARVWGRLVVDSWLGGITDNSAPHGGGVSLPGGILEMRPGHVRDNRATAATGRGGGIHVLDGGVITATESSNVFGNTAYDGAGIYADDARVHLSVLVHGNTADNHGGGIYLSNGSRLSANQTHIGYPTVSGLNQAATGGGVYARDSVIEFNGYFYNNHAETQGGGIFAESSAITLTNTHVGGTDAHEANHVTAQLLGAGLYFSATQARLSNTVVASNTFSSGAGWGGGIAAWNGSGVTLTHGSRVEHHHAPNVGAYGGAGAGVLVHDSTVTLDNSQVLSNTADVSGGGIYMVEASTLNVLNGSVIANNYAVNEVGGGIAAVGTPEINISRTTMRDNSAATAGGAIYLNEGALNVAHAYLYGNNADRGGAIYQTGVATVAEVSNSLIHSNTSNGGLGAGIRTEGGTFAVNHVTLASNVSGAGYSQSNTDGYVTNSIAWGNEMGGFQITSGPINADCNIDQSDNVGSNVDPLFVAPGAGEDYRLRSGSPAIDACATGLSPDLDGVSRPHGDTYDMGAYEYALGIAFAPDRSGTGPSPGTVTYTHTLTNTGAVRDTYMLSANSNNGWSATVAPTTQITLDGGQSASVTVSLSIPADVVSGTVDALTVTATSGIDPSLMASVTNTTRAVLPSYTIHLPVVLQDLGGP